MDLATFLRDVPDFPKPGILFKDITPLLAEPRALAAAIDRFAALDFGKVDKIAAIESRGFLFGAPLALRHGIGFVPVRKPGKLPWKTNRVEYVLEYGTDAVEIHQDAIRPGERVLLVDDLLATGGTMGAACQLVEACGGAVAGCAFVVELCFLPGREKLAARRIATPIAIRYGSRGIFHTLKLFQGNGLRNPLKKGPSPYSIAEGVRPIISNRPARVTIFGVAAPTKVLLETANPTKVGDAKP